MFDHSSEIHRGNMARKRNRIDILQLLDTPTTPKSVRKAWAEILASFEDGEFNMSTPEGFTRVQEAFGKALNAALASEFAGKPIIYPN
jgi:hypothetical protein